ncbi:MAG TPA: carboxypeptidase regulatory-like domain-containing protein [Bryobacteraceae bacterium]|nr:carboxypeptidase regulatory-like domain-containing protein [Bryobacteraceae bacterium]
MSSLTLFAQDDRASFTGSITDPSQAAIPGVTVEVSIKATGFHREGKTNDAGVYLIPGLLVGIYDVNIGKDGFRTEQYNGVELVVGQVRTINAQMQLAANTQSVEVQADAPALAQSSATVGGVISSSQVADLPLNGRAWTSLMALVPGAINSGGGTQQSIRFAGRGVDDNNYRFDGVDATAISNQAPNSSFRLQISTEAIAEFKVDTALYGAETGGSSGGQVEVISKSGSNDLHGSVFEYLRNNVISSRGPFDPSTLPPLRLNQYGGSVGGAIIKNRTFFFAAFEGLQQRAHGTLIGNVPSDSFRAQVLAQSPVLAPIINSYPVGNRAFTANVSQYVSTGSISSGENSGLIRIDHRFSDNTSFFARYNIDQVLLSSPSGSLLDVAKTDAAPMNGSMNLSHVFSATMFNNVELGVNRIHAVNITDSHFFDTTKIFNSVSVPGFTKLNQASNAVKSPTSYSLKDDFTWTRGAHTIQAGVELKKILYNYSQASENALVWSTLANFAANKLDQVNLIGGVPTHGLDKMMYFGYVQDAWKMRPNFTLNIGLRYEFFNVFHEIYGRDIPFDINTCGGFCPVGSQFTYPVTDNLEPRVSFAWSPQFLRGKTVIRSGFGTYKGEGQLGDLNAPSDNYAQRSSLSSSSFPALSFPADPYYALAGNVAVTPRALIRNRQDPTVDQWGLQVQTALPAGFILDTGYVGYHAYHQFARTYVNLINPATGTRPLPGFGPIDQKGTSDNSHFEAWQTSLQRRLRAGASFSLNYMWSHAINDGSTGGGEADYPQNNACRTCEVASADFDVRHVVSANSVYDLPFGKGRRYLNSGGITNFIFGGWQLSGILSARSGNPVNVTITLPASALSDGLSLQNGSVFTRPNYVYGVSVVPAHQTITDWINPLAFTAPANQTWGNAGRNLVRGPDFCQVDLALAKSFPITERFVLDFRTEAFNAFNRAQFGDPSGDFSSPSFGQITTTVNNGSATGSVTPREFQFSMRLHF